MRDICANIVSKELPHSREFTSPSFRMIDALVLLEKKDFSTWDLESLLRVAMFYGLRSL